MKKNFFTMILLGMLALLMSCSHDHSTTLQGYIEGRFTYFASSVSGHLEQLFVSRGQEVKSGHKLFALDSFPQTAQLEQAQKNLIAEKEKLINLEKGSRETILQSIRAQVDQARSDLELAKLTLDRRARLVKKGAISQAEYDDAYTSYQIKQKAVTKLESDLLEAELGARTHIIREQAARVQGFEADIKRLSWELSQKTGVAPEDGQVFDTFYQKNEFVPAGQSILALLFPQDIYVVFFIPEPLLSTVKMGQSVTFTCDNCKPQIATIYYISPTTEYTPPIIYTKESRQKLVFRVEAAIPLNKAANFHPGQPVDVTISGTPYGK